jgi:hypothetical protein
MTKDIRSLRHPPKLSKKDRYNLNKAERRELSYQQTRLKPQLDSRPYYGRHFQKLSPVEKLVLMLMVTVYFHRLVVSEETKSKISHSSYANQSLCMADERVFTPGRSGNETSMCYASFFANAAIKHPEPKVQYKGIDAYDVTGKIKLCTKKARGVTDGRVCYVQNAKYLLKNTCGKSQDHSDRNINNPLRGIYNFKLLREVIGITVPEVSIVYEKIHSDSRLYFASKFMDDFTTIREFKCKERKKYKKYNDGPGEASFSAFYRKALSAKIGEDGIEKLMVAVTLVSDLDNQDNWGYNADGLVVIDADVGAKLTKNGTLEHYYTWAARSIKNLDIDLSPDNIANIIKIYQRMIKNKLPAVHAEVDLSLENYHQLLNSYISAFENTLLAFQRSDPMRPNAAVNVALIKNIKDLAHEQQATLALR